MYKIIQESNLLLSLLFLTELKLFPGLKLEFLEAFFNSSQGYYYSRASLSNNKSCLELKKTSRKLHFNPGNSFRSVKNSRESNKVLLAFCREWHFWKAKFQPPSVKIGRILWEGEYSQKGKKSSKRWPNVWLGISKRCTKMLHLKTSSSLERQAETTPAAGKASRLNSVSFCPHGLWGWNMRDLSRSC